jgi:hypothetical protein
MMNDEGKQEFSCRGGGESVVARQTFSHRRGFCQPCCSSRIEVRSNPPRLTDNPHGSRLYGIEGKDAIPNDRPNP